MWKNLSRRLKDTVERTYNSILDVSKPITCGTQQNASNDRDSKCDQITFCHNLKPNPDCFVVVSRGEYSKNSNDNSEGQQERFRARFNDEEQHLHNTLLGALTWSGAIVCGWYASHLCFNRRHRLVCEDYNKNRYARLLNIPNRALQSGIRSYIAFASAPEQSNVKQCEVTDHYLPASHAESSPTIDDGNNEPYQINNPHNHENGIENQAPLKQTVEEAVSDLVSFLGETEFKMGVQQIAAGRFRSAVVHLKLATSHNHPGATFNLGLCYERGLGVQKNLRRAMECYQVASSLGHSKAMYNLGVFYARGLGGLERDHNTAEKCFSTAAKLGQEEAKFALSHHEEKTTATKADPFLLQQESKLDITNSFEYFISPTTVKYAV